MASPLCSVLIPSRGRAEKLVRAVRSFLASASTPSAVEILVKLDDDDAPSLAALPELRQLGVVAMVTPRLQGLLGLNRFFNAMAALASGDWIWGFNDDAVMSTPNWDSLLQAQGNGAQKALIVMPWVDSPIFSAQADIAPEKAWHYDFPIVSRRVYEIVGCHSPSPLSDCFIFELIQAVPSLRILLKEMAVTHYYDRDDTHPHRPEGSEIWRPSMEVHRSAQVRTATQEAIRKIELLLPK